MPRPLRPIDDYLVYHVISRGNNRAPVFHANDDYAAFLRAIGDLKQRRPFAFYGDCLMPNHVHLVIRPLEAPISRLLQSLLVSHTQRYHRCHRSGGHVWQGRFKSPVIQDGDPLLTVLRSIEANPLRAGMVEAAGDYRWSSFAAHGLTRARSTRPSRRPPGPAGVGCGHLSTRTLRMRSSPPFGARARPGSPSGHRPGSIGSRSGWAST